MGTRFLYGGHVHANGIRQHYLRYGGSGPTVLLVPGITSPAITWGFVAERLGASYDVYVLDVRGRGLSETGDHLDYSRKACAEDAAAFVTAMGFKQYVYLGHSMGARIGVLLGRLQPEEIKSMVLIDPPMSGPGRQPYPADVAWYLDSLRLMKAGAGVDALRPFCPTWSEYHLRLRAEWLHTCNECAVINAYEGLNDDDIHADMSYLKMPVLLMAAGRGAVITEQDLEEVRSLIPTMTVRLVPKAGHMIPYDDEEDFFRALEEFLGVRC